MPKIIVTQALAEAIRTVRNQKYIAAKDLATHIGKTPSYISKLEHGEIKTISQEDFESILSCIMPDDTFDEQMLSIINSVGLRYTAKEIEEQLWITNYDTVFRQIPIPAELIQGLNQRISESNISIDYLTQRINSNEMIPQEIKQHFSKSKNEWLNYKPEDGKQGSYIFMEVSTDKIESILSGQLISCNYVIMLAITVYLAKIEKYGDAVDIPDHEELLRESEKYLNSFNFYTLVERNKRIQQSVSEDDLSNVLSSFDYENQKIVSEIIAAFRAFSDLNVKKANEQFEVFLNNLKWDSSFIMRLITIDFHKLGNVSFQFKKRLLSELIDVFNESNDADNTKKQLEVYDI